MSGAKLAKKAAVGWGQMCSQSTGSKHSPVHFFMLPSPPGPAGFIIRRPDHMKRTDQMDLGLKTRNDAGDDLLLAPALLLRNKRANKQAPDFLRPWGPSRRGRPSQSGRWASLRFIEQSGFLLAQVRQPTRDRRSRSDAGLMSLLQAIDRGPDPRLCRRLDPPTSARRSLRTLPGGPTSQRRICSPRRPHLLAVTRPTV